MTDDFDSTVQKIVARTGLSRDEVLRRIWEKHRELAMVTVEGAAEMVGRELGVDVGE